MEQKKRRRESQVSYESPFPFPFLSYYNTEFEVLLKHCVIFFQCCLKTHKNSCHSTDEGIISGETDPIPVIFSPQCTQF